MKKRYLNILFWLVVAGIVIFAVYTYYSRHNANAGTDIGQLPQKIEAPDFALSDMDGNTVRLSDLRGKVVFVNFWATWCGYCVNEMKDLDRAYAQMAKDGNAVLLAVNIQESGDQVKKFMAQNGLTLPVLFDSEAEAASSYGVSGIPVTYIINRDGTIYNYIGGPTDEKTLLKLANKLK